MSGISVSEQKRRNWQQRRAKGEEGDLAPLPPSFYGCKDCRSCEKTDCRHNPENPEKKNSLREGEQL